MEQFDGEFTIWVPSKRKAAILCLKSQEWIAIPRFGAIYIPLLTQSSPFGETNRIEQFQTGKRRLFNY